MKLGLLLGLGLVANGCFAGGLLFDVKSSNDGIVVPITLCLSGTAEMSCQNYTVTGYDLEIKTNTKNNKTFPNAGIKVNTTGYKLSDCTPYNNGYCIFAANSWTYVHIGLK